VKELPGRNKKRQNEGPREIAEGVRPLREGQNSNDRKLGPPVRALKTEITCMCPASENLAPSPETFLKRKFPTIHTKMPSTLGKEGKRKWRRKGLLGTIQGRGKQMYSNSRKKGGGGNRSYEREVLRAAEEEEKGSPENGDQGGITENFLLVEVKRRKEGIVEPTRKALWKGDPSKKGTDSCHIKTSPGRGEAGVPSKLLCGGVFRRGKRGIKKYDKSLRGGPFQTPLSLGTRRWKKRHVRNKSLKKERGGKWERGGATEGVNTGWPLINQKSSEPL